MAAVDQHNHLIHQLYVRQQFEECTALIDKVLADSSGRCEYALHVKALIARQRGLIQDSLRLFQQATALNPHSIANLKQVGRSLYLLGKHRAAVDVYDEALKLQDNDTELWLSKGLCAVQLRDYDRALQSFQKANSIQPHDTTYMQIGNVYMEQGNLEAALSTYMEALENSPDNPDILTTLGITFLRLGDNQRAFDNLGTSLLHDPRNPRTLLAVGSIIQDHHDMDVALVKYRVAAAVCPNSPQLWNNIGMCFYGKQRYIAAIACLKRALYLGPFEWVVAYNLGLVHLCTGQAASAFHFLSTAINLNPEFAHSYMHLGMALHQLTDFENAIAAYDKAVSLEPQEPLLHLNYAMMLHSIGSSEDARRYLAQYQQLASQGAANQDAEVAEKAAQLEQLLQASCAQPPS